MKEYMDADNIKMVRFFANGVGDIIYKDGEHPTTFEWGKMVIKQLANEGLLNHKTVENVEFDFPHLQGEKFIGKIIFTENDFELMFDADEQTAETAH